MNDKESYLISAVKEAVFLSGFEANRAARIKMLKLFLLFFDL
jgi:hypothetical protein